MNTLRFFRSLFPDPAAIVRSQVESINRRRTELSNLPDDELQQTARQTQNLNDAIAATAGNFLRAVPFAALISVMMIPQMHLDSLGVTYAIISGAITSGLGYVIWYAALPDLKAASAATVQLSVPMIAATGGILLLGEPITLRYVIASIAVLGGIFLVVIEKRNAIAR